MANDKQDMILAELMALRKQVADLMGSASSKPARKPAKPKDPNAPPKAPSDWNVFLGVVRQAFKDANKPLGTHAMAYASYLKNTYPDAYSWDAESIVAEHASWVPPEPKPKAEKPVAEDGDKPKPKRTLTPEHIAAMQAGKKKAAEARKAVEDASKAAEVEVVADKPPAPVVADASGLSPLPWKGKRMLLDKASGGVWLRNPDGSRGEWQGILSADKKTLDNSVAEPGV
jgi:hypothetical protein